MSKLKVDQISKATGASPAIFTLPAADGTTGQYLKTDGSGILSWGTPPDQKITNASQWRLTADFTGDATPIGDSVGVIEEVDAPVGFGVLGDSMTQSSGVFTFPSTGYWLITFNPLWYTAEANAYLYGKIKTTPDNASYSEAARAGSSANDGTAGSTSATCQYIFDVVSTSTHKVKFDIDIAGSTGICQGDTDFNETHMTFLRLADRP